MPFVARFTILPCPLPRMGIEVPTIGYVHSAGFPEVYRGNPELARE